MNHFDYRNGVLHAEGVNLIALAEAVGTPFYCYASATLERHYTVFAGAFADVDDFSARRNHTEHFAADQRIVQHDISGAEQTRTFDGQEFGITGTCADQVNLAGGLRRAGH